MTDSSGSASPLLNLAQAAKIIGRDRTALHDDIRAGKLRAIQVGRIWLVTEADLMAFDKLPRVGRDLPRGPKSKLSDPKLAAKLERLLEQGQTVVDAMKAIGLSRDRFYRANATRPEFRARMDAARRRGAVRRRAELADVAREAITLSAPAAGSTGGHWTPSEGSHASRRAGEVRAQHRPRDPARRARIALDRTSASAAAAAIEAAYPQEAERRTCLVRLAGSILLVRDLPVDHWMITLQVRSFARQARVVTLNVSKLAAVCFLPGTLRLLVEKAGVPVDVWNLSLAIGGPPMARLRTASNLEWVDLPSDQLDELLPRCEAAHNKAVLQASAGGRSPYLRAHSSGVVAYLNAALGEHIVGS